MVESRQRECLTIVAIFTVLAFIFTATRVYSRYLGHNFGWDDYLIINATLVLLGQTIATWKFILLSGTGFHVWDLPKKSIKEQITSNQWSFAVQMFYHPMMFAIRASIIVFLWRMKDKRRRIRYSLHVVFLLNIIYGVGTTLGNILQCTPVEYAWNKPAMDTKDIDGNLIKGGKCFDSRTFILTSCALSIFMDLIIIPIPSIMVWNLQMDRKIKMLVVGVMSLGWVATGVSVGRFIVYYYRFAPSNTDRSWDIGIAISIAEPAVHIMTACAPATKRLYRFLFPYFARSHNTTYYEDRITTNKSNNQRNFSRFSFGLNNDDHMNEDAVEEIVMAPQKQKERGLKRLSTMDSGEEIKEDKSSIHVAEAEPQHCLGHAR